MTDVDLADDNHFTKSDNINTCGEASQEKGEWAQIDLSMNAKRNIISDTIEILEDHRRNQG